MGDDTTAIDSVLRADVWRESLLKEEAALNAKLAELEGESDEKRFDDARDETSARLVEVHQSLADMEAESGPARAATLLAGMVGPLRRLVRTNELFQDWASARGINSAIRSLSAVDGGTILLSKRRRSRNALFLQNAACPSAGTLREGELCIPRVSD